MAEELSDKSAALPGCLLTILGASGDLTKRLLLPSLLNLVGAKVLPEEFRLLGVAREDWDDAKFKEHIEASLKEFAGAEADSDAVRWLCARAAYQQGDFHEPASFDAVKSKVEAIERESGLAGNRLFYLAVAPSFIATITSLLSHAGLLTEDSEKWRRVIIEKPFGHDLASAKALNEELQKSLREEQIYRIDHFAGKDAVQDLAVFRFSNAFVEHLWNRSMIDHVQITVAESVGVEGRAAFYEESGALRDMVPNHLAEVLSMVAMEPPVSLTADHMRDKQVELLESIRQIDATDVGRFAVRGQYGAGTIDGKDVPGYREEEGVDPQSNTETYVALHVEIDNWRWAGVPFFLRTGKRFPQAFTEVVVTFRPPPARLFPKEDGEITPNRLVFRMKPKQDIQLFFGAKVPGLKTAVEDACMSFEFQSGAFGVHATGYERLLHDAIAGNSMLFQRAEFVEMGWRMVQPFLNAWKDAPVDAFPNYAAGSNGPKASDDMLSELGYTWQSGDNH